MRIISFLKWRVGVLVTAQVRDCPGHISKESDLDVWFDESQERGHYAVVDHKVPEKNQD